MCPLRKMYFSQLWANGVVASTQQTHKVESHSKFHFVKTIPTSHYAKIVHQTSPESGRKQYKVPRNQELPFGKFPFCDQVIRLSR